MTATQDMSTPVTRGELREELQQVEGRFDEKLERLLARIESGEQRMTAAISNAIEASEQRMRTDLARHANAIHEAVASQISVIDEKYKDLPARMSRVEATLRARASRTRR